MRKSLESSSRSELWQLPFGTPQIDPERLAGAIEIEAAEHEPDFRTRLLIRDGLLALKQYWGQARFQGWLNRSVARETMERILREDLGAPGFSTIGPRLMNETKRETIEQFLRELGDAVRAPQEMIIGGAGALILLGHLRRHTSDIDVVDEIPASLRTEHQLLDELSKRFGLRLTHFQSHYLPDGWRERTRSVGQAAQLKIRVVDPTDVFVGKLFSARAKDRDDLRALAGQLLRGDIESRIASSASRFLADASLRANAEKNWYIVYGGALPA